MNGPEIRGTGKPPGKFSARELKSLVFNHLGALSSKVFVGPGLGKDFNAVELDETRLLLMTTDPIYFNDVFGIEAGAWLAFQIILSDMLTSGILPQYAIFSLNLPNTLNKGDFERIWKIFDSECKRLDICITCGHTGRYDGCNLPIIGSGTFLSVCRKQEVVHVGLVNTNDDIVLINGPGLEAIASLMKIDESTVSLVFGDDRAGMLDHYWDILSIEKALATMTNLAKDMNIPLPGIVHGMHDVAERGVMGAMLEFCEATGKGCDIILDDWIFEKGIEHLWKHFFGDLGSIWHASGQGGLLVAMNPGFTSKLVKACHEKGIVAAKLGRLTNNGDPKVFKLHGVTGTINDGMEDPFWPIFKVVLERR